ncbi:hypothetical protein [Micromonospora lupini]|uniref:DUF11 domain-containing protein n=1 Tax=Micromonospora lupini str. Lupac 08 TaxID=1150864 RepID=I0KUZ8_9ACTN|nr:hypothetical protein [Micromonospora lupini]CCH15395.1 Exported hypothetical protein [Micromonospora lupini str. Lupac 08]
MRSVHVTRGRLLRGLTALVVATAAVGATAGPAAAEGDPGWVSGWLGDVTVGGPGAPGRTVPLNLSSTGATEPRVTIDLAGLTGVATASFPDWCVTGGTSVTCPMPPTAVDENGTLTGVVPVVFRAAPGAADGASGTLDYTASGEQTEAYAQQATITVRSGPGLLDMVDENVSGVEVGDTRQVPVAVVNAGDQPAVDLRLTMRFAVGLVPASYRNCRYGTDQVLATVVVCTVRGTFAPGQRHELRGGLATTVGPATLGGKRITQIVEPLADAGPLPSGVRLRHREADQALRLRPVGKPLGVIPVGVDGAGGQTYLHDVRGAFDVVAQGATVTGAVGDTVHVTVGLRNEGPGVPDGTNSGDTVGAFLFTPPTGVTVLANPLGCGRTGGEDGEPLTRTWHCTGRGAVFPAGTSNTVTFDLRIDSLAGAAGEVQPSGRYPRVDDNPGNDIAPVTVS